jgi:ribosome-associated toxin RatA of RatAB toxin-antitoxin module
MPNMREAWMLCCVRPSPASAKLLLPFVFVTAWSVLASATVLAQTPTPHICGENAERFRNGHIAVKEQVSADGRGVALRVCGEVEAPPATVWTILRDCDRFHEFMPGVAMSRLVKREENVVWCDEIIDVPFPLADMTALTRVVESSLPDGGFERRWNLVRGSFRRLEGAWTIHPAEPSATRSVVLYELQMEPDTLVPNFLVRYAQSIAAPQVFNSVRERVRQCGVDGTCGGR